MYSFVSSYYVIKSMLDSYNEEGSSDLSHYCSNYSHNFKNVRSTCYKVLMFLNYLEGYNKPDYIASGCRFLNYWLYNDDILKDTNNFNALAFYQTLKSNDKQSFFLHKDVCGGNMEHISKDIIANIQKLIKLHENFNTNLLKKEPLNYECKEILECANVYEAYMEEFCVDINNVFCVELENFKPKYDDYMKNKKCGENVPKTLKSIQRVNIAAAVVLPFVIILVFTSFVPWLLPRIRKNNRIFNNLNDENNHMALLHSESHESYINKREYNIAYRSTINS
ncbi:PIR protein [Plasmodium ovale]|uniref:PIR protein n=1 Tax=Plasmodium ovale TaxID=36330 RepID=A0A1C3KEK9_PLAOA|nr:PIR protein [Plasmodium ovale]